MNDETACACFKKRTRRSVATTSTIVQAGPNTFVLNLFGRGVTVTKKLLLELTMPARGLPPSPPFASPFSAMAAWIAVLASSTPIPPPSPMLSRAALAWSMFDHVLGVVKLEGFLEDLFVRVRVWYGVRRGGGHEECAECRTRCGAA